jgi:hypothetical protein
MLPGQTSQKKNQRRLETRRDVQQGGGTAGSTGLILLRGKMRVDLGIGIFKMIYYI